MKPNKQYRTALAERQGMIQPRITNKAFAAESIPGTGYVGRKGKRPASDKGQPGEWRDVKAFCRDGRF